MFAVMACVWIYKEVTSVSATTALRLLRTRRCAWVRRRTLVSGGDVELRLQKRLQFGHSPQVTTKSLSETVLQKMSSVKLFMVLFNVKFASRTHHNMFFGSVFTAFFPR